MMEWLKYVIVVVLIVALVFLASFIMRPAPCSHDSTLDPGPDLVTLGRFEDHCKHNGAEMSGVSRQITDIYSVLIIQKERNIKQQEVNDAQVGVNKALQNHNVANLDGMKKLGDGIITNAKTIEQNQAYIKQNADNMVQFATMIKNILEGK